MRTELPKVLDECIERIRNGETIETCLSEYPDMREQIRPLLYTTLSIFAIPKVSPSDEFRRISKARLMMRLRQESSRAKAAKSGQGITLPNELAAAWQRLLQGITGAKKVTIPVTIILVLALVAGLSGALNFLSPPPALASQCTLSILSGNVEVQESAAESWQKGTDGMILSVSARVKTTPSYHALLTFFEGTTIKLEPSTDVEIQQIERTDEQSATIILKQRLGKTWSHVAKIADTGSHYQVETPLASTIAQGTLFTTEVDETGFTQVATTEGLVSVVAQGEEVYLPAGQQTQVEPGAAPSQPVIIPDPSSEIIVTIDMPAVGSVTDPTGSSTGYLTSGLTYNQIVGAQSSSPSEGTQLITIAEPVTGEYVITLRYIAEGTAHFSIYGKSEDKVVFAYTGTWGAGEESGWLIHLSLHVDDGLIVDSTVSGVEPLGDETPENIVETQLATESAVPIKPPEDGDKGKPEDEDEGTGIGEDEGTGKGEDKGNGKGEDKGKGKNNTGNK